LADPTGAAAASVTLDLTAGNVIGTYLTPLDAAPPRIIFFADGDRVPVTFADGATSSTSLSNVAGVVSPSGIAWAIGLPDRSPGGFWGA
jgi:hypothetical protein